MIYPENATELIHGLHDYAERVDMFVKRAENYSKERPQMSSDEVKKRRASFRDGLCCLKAEYLLAEVQGQEAKEAYARIFLEGREKLKKLTII